MKKVAAPSPIITSNKKIVEKVKTVIQSDEDIIILEPVTKHHEHGGKDERILLLTSSNISLVRLKTFGGIERNHIYSIYKLTKLFYAEPDSFILNFDKDQISISTKEAQKMCQIILYLHSVIFYGSPSTLVIETQPQGLLTPVKHVTRPSSVFQTRLKCFAYIYHIKVHEKTLKFFKDMDSKPSPNLKLPASVITDTTEMIGLLIGMDPDIKLLYLDNFSHKTLDVILPAIFANTKSLNALTFDNYKEPPQKQFSLQTRENSKIAEISFKHSSFQFINTILSSMSKCGGRISSLKLESCQLAGANVKSIFDSLHKYPVFMRIKYLFLTDGVIDDMDLRDFSILLTRSRYLKFLSITKSSKETSAILKSIFRNATALANLAVTNCRFLEPLDEETEIPPCIAMIDISQNQISSEAMNSLSKAMFLKPRRNALTFYASELASSSTSSELLDAFIVDNARPVLAEFRWSRNEMTPEDTEKLFNFMRTQSTLRYMTLSGCFVEQIPECFAHVTKFVQEGRLQGLELATCPCVQYPGELVKLLKTFVGVKPLQILNLERSEIGDQGLIALKQIIDANESFFSISCDGAKPSSLPSLLNFYEHISTVSHLTGVGIPRADFALFRKSPGMVQALRYKSPPSSATHRLTVYEKVSTQVQGEEGPRDLKKVLFDDGISSQALTNPLDELMIYLDAIVNPENEEEKAKKQAKKPTDGEEEDEPEEEEEENDEKDGDEKKKKAAPHVDIPSPDELCSLFLSSLQTSTVASMSNKIKNMEKKKTEESEDLYKTSFATRNRTNTVISK